MIALLFVRIDSLSTVESLGKLCGTMFWLTAWRRIDSRGKEPIEVISIGYSVAN